MTVALARKYRPRRFADLLVQDHVAQVLRGAVTRERVGHAYLLTGPRGVGKTTAARILAMALNCQQRLPDGDPCGECASCARIWTGAASLDVVEIDAASNRGVDDARDLRERAMYAASQEGGYKVYIVDEAHMLTREAWNALLKILEEPPPRVVFVFATTEPQKIAQSAAPVLSRVQRFDFRRIGAPVIRARLQAVLAAEGIAADDDALTLIARHADGGMRDALSLLDQCLSFGDGAVSAARVREVLGVMDDAAFAEALRIVVERDPAAVFPLVRQLLDAGADLTGFVADLGAVVRALLMLELGAAPPEDLTQPVRERLEAVRGQLAVGDLLRMLRMLADDEQAIRRSASPQLVVETLLVRWAVLDRVVSLEEVLRAGGGGPPAEAPADPRPAPARRAPPPAERARADTPAAAAPAPAAAPGPLDPTLEAVRGAWPGIVAAAVADSPLLGRALQEYEVRGVAPGDVDIAWVGTNPAHEELPEKTRSWLGNHLGARLGAPVRVRVQERASAAPAPRPARLTAESIRADRLQSLRAADPALDAAASELDLEIVD